VRADATFALAPRAKPWSLIIAQAIAHFVKYITNVFIFIHILKCEAHLIFQNLSRKKIVTNTQGTQVVNKGCAYQCNNGKVLGFGPSQITTFCCRNDFCNDTVKLINLGGSAARAMCVSLVILAIALLKQF
jgi:hypothetical protein